MTKQELIKRIERKINEEYVEKELTDSHGFKMYHIGKVNALLEVQLLLLKMED